MPAELSTLYLRGMPTGLVREAKVVAARRGATLTAIVSEALAASLGQAAGGTGNDLVRDERWFARNRAHLLTVYPGEYVAILDRAVIDHDADFDALATRVFALVGARSVLVPFLAAAPAPPRIRSPRIRR